MEYLRASTDASAIVACTRGGAYEGGGVDAADDASGVKRGAACALVDAKVIVTPTSSVGALAFARAGGEGSIVSWKLAAALAAKNIGGGVNYVAVATALEMSREEFVAGVAADNVFALAYFPLVSFLARRCDARGDDARDGARR